jgi:GT2 family glycosyltransferase
VEPFLVDPRVRLVRQENRGLAGARNTAVEHARGRFFSLLDGDDLWLPEYLERVAALFDRGSECAVAIVDAWIMDDRSRRIYAATAMEQLDPPDPLPADPRDFLVELLRRNFLLAFATIRRDAVESVGGFDTELRAAEDYDLWIRLASRGHAFAAVSGGPLAVYRFRDHSLTRDHTHMWRSLRMVYGRVAANDELPEPLRKQALASVARAERMIGVTSGSRSLGALKYRLRIRAARLKNRVGSGGWRSEPPAELVRAFPDILSS